MRRPRWIATKPHIRQGPVHLRLDGATAPKTWVRASSLIVRAEGEPAAGIGRQARIVLEPEIAGHSYANSLVGSTMRGEDACPILNPEAALTAGCSTCTRPARAAASIVPSRRAGSADP